MGGVPLKDRDTLSAASVHGPRVTKVQKIGEARIPGARWRGFSALARIRCYVLSYKFLTDQLSEQQYRSLMEAE